MGITHPLTVSPDPTNGLLRLHRAPSAQIDAVEVLDVNGRVVLRLGRPADDLIDLGSLESGVYMIRAFMQQGLRTARVVRE